MVAPSLQGPCNHHETSDFLWIYPVLTLGSPYQRWSPLFLLQLSSAFPLEGPSASCSSCLDVPSLCMSEYNHHRPCEPSTSWHLWWSHHSFTALTIAAFMTRLAFLERIRTPYKTTEVWQNLTTFSGGKQDCIKLSNYQSYRLLKYMNVGWNVVLFNLPYFLMPFWTIITLG